MYSTSVLDCVLSICFFDFHSIAPLAAVNKIPDVDMLYQIVWFPQGTRLFFLALRNVSCWGWLCRLLAYLWQKQCPVM